MNDVPLYSSPVPGEFQPFMTPYLLNDGKKHGCVIVLPGGGYAFRAPHEDAPIAHRFNELGFHAVCLEYRVAPAQFPAPQLDALTAVRIVRSRAREWNVAPDKIAVLGFSAGGHLAASTGVMHSELATPGLEDVSGRPDALILCYAVISGRAYGHHGSFASLLGSNDPSWEDLSKVSWNERIPDDYPPCFIWHTATDNAVPVETALDLATALQRKHKYYELVIFPEAGHGVGLAADYPDICKWPELAADFLKKLDFA